MTWGQAVRQVGRAPCPDHAPGRGPGRDHGHAPGAPHGSAAGVRCSASADASACSGAPDSCRARADGSAAPSRRCKFDRTIRIVRYFRDFSAVLWPTGYSFALGAELLVEIGEWLLVWELSVSRAYFQWEITYL